MILKSWNLKVPQPKLQSLLRDALNVHPIIAKLLVNRNVKTVDDAKFFLSSDLKHLNDPFLFKDMSKAIDRIKQAKDRDELVMVFGDYDVDGITSSALMHDVLVRMGVRVVNHIPHRFDDGYGLSDSIIPEAKEQGVALIISVDCGVTAFNEVDAINKAGIEVIVIDHHEPDGNRVPNAVAVIDPKRPDCQYPFKHFAAVGLALKVSQALFGEVFEEDLDLVALGTIADVASLTGENRILAQKGLKQIAVTKRTGLRALMDVAKIKSNKIKPYFVGFILGPRLNAAGRIDTAAKSLELLLSTDPKEALILAKNLDDQNKERQKLQTRVTQEAMKMIEQEGGLEDDKIIVVHKQGWHKGVVGIVASRIMEKFFRPAIVISVEEGVGVGSARSIEGFHLYDALAQCSDILENFGGHKRAAGVTLKQENIEQFRALINSFAKDLAPADEIAPSLTIDTEIKLDQMNVDLIHNIEALEPFGEGNASPIFCSKGLIVKSIPKVLGKETIKFWVSDGVCNVSAVGFGMAKYKEIIKVGQPIDLAFNLSIDDWNKAPTVQLTLKDIKAVGAG